MNDMCCNNNNETSWIWVIIIVIVAIWLIQNGSVFGNDCGCGC